METIFTRIIKGEIPAKKIYEDDTLLAFLDINPVQKGHTLIITKTSYQRMQECDDETLAHAFLTAKKLMIHIKEKLGVDYIQLVVEGIQVPHFHIHLIPSMIPVENAQQNQVIYNEGEMNEYQKKLVTTL